MEQFTQIERSLKGRTTEALAILVFERGLYRVAKVGVEELLREVKVLPLDQYKALGLEKSLRTMPDLLVTNVDVTHAFQVEIKFRSDFAGRTRQALAELLEEQRKYWPKTYTLVMLGACPGRRRAGFFQDYVRVIPPDFDLQDLKEKILDSDVWKKLKEVGEVFKGVKRSDFAVDALVPLLRTLNEAKENNDA